MPTCLKPIGPDGNGHWAPIRNRRRPDRWPIFFDQLTISISTLVRIATDRTSHHDQQGADEKKNPACPPDHGRTGNSHCSSN
jgi:hypothetical protein